MNTIYHNRFLARIVIEAETPIVIGSGEQNITTDSLVTLDVNGLPYIPATSIAGVLRHAIGEKEAETFFGHKGNKTDSGHGSEIIFSEGKMIGENGHAIDGLQNLDWNSDFYKYYQELPIRQHVRITEKGVAEKAGKFDEQVVFKGTRFCFEIEMVSKDNNTDNFNKVLKNLRLDSLRIGSGARSGFGKIKVISIKKKELDLKKAEDLTFYIEKSSSLSTDFEGEPFEAIEEETGFVRYDIILHPKDFFLFGSGFGDDEVDMTPVKEDIVIWNEGKPKFEKQKVLIPATSVKGALAHRTAFYWNKQKGYFSDNTDENKKPLYGQDNKAVSALFGSEGIYNSKSKEMEGQKCGNAIFSDVIEQSLDEKTLNHVAIDRFTGGAIDGALFSEKTTDGRNSEGFKMEILIKEDALADKDIQKSFELALDDMTHEMLPLGGGVNRGNGIFEGEWNSTKKA